MLLAHGGEITADEIGELALLSLPVAVLLVAFVVLADRARAARNGGAHPAGGDVREAEHPVAADDTLGKGR